VCIFVCALLRAFGCILCGHASPHRAHVFRGVDTKEPVGSSDLPMFVLGGGLGLAVTPGCGGVHAVSVCVVGWKGFGIRVGLKTKP
jgi:hypothetical protein